MLCPSYAIKKVFGNGGLFHFSMLASWLLGYEESKGVAADATMLRGHHCTGDVRFTNTTVLSKYHCLIHLLDEALPLSSIKDSVDGRNKFLGTVFCSLLM